MNSFLYVNISQGRRTSDAYVTVENFRPNLVVAGGVAHQEDLWEAIELVEAEASGKAGGEAEDPPSVCLRVTGPCARCSMVNIDHQDKEPYNYKRKCSC